jgi:hypothetical protein
MYKKACALKDEKAHLKCSHFHCFCPKINHEITFRKTAENVSEILSNTYVAV